MKNLLKNIVFGIYVVVAIFITICLLSYDDYGTTVFGSYTFIIITSNDIDSDKYTKGDLVIIDNEQLGIETGEYVFFYSISGSNVEIAHGEVTSYEIVTSKETTYEIENDVSVSSEYILGSDEDATIINNVGTILSILESKWGFLFLVVLPTLIALLYEIMVVITEVRDDDDD